MNRKELKNYGGCMDRMKIAIMRVTLERSLRTSRDEWEKQRLIAASVRLMADRHCKAAFDGCKLTRQQRRTKWLDLHCPALVWLTRLVHSFVSFVGLTLWTCSFGSIVLITRSLHSLVLFDLYAHCLPVRLPASSSRSTSTLSRL